MKKNPQFVPKYEMIYRDLHDKIRARFWKYGEKIPSKALLCRKYKVSLITLKTVMQKLQADGLVKSVRGTGTFVTWKREQDFGQPFHLRQQASVEIFHTLLQPAPTYSYTMNMLADSFMEKNPQVKIRFIDLRITGASDPYLDIFNSDRVPTCGEFYWQAIYAKLNALYPLDKFDDFGEFRDELHSSAFSPMPDGNNEPHFHGVNLYIGPPLFLLLNSDLLERFHIPCPGKNLSWPQLRHLQTLLSREKIPADIHSAAIKLPKSYHNVKPFIELMGQDLFCRSSEPVTVDSFRRIFSEESAALALEHLLKIAESGRPLFDQGAEYFAMGKVGTCICASNWNLILMETMNPGMNYIASPLPPVGRNRHYRSFYSGFNVGIFRQGIDSDLQLHTTWQWLRFLFYQRSQYLFSQSFHLPVRKGAESFLQKRYPMLNVIAENMLKNALPQPDFVGMRAAYSSVGKRLNALFQKQLSIENCLSGIREDLSRQFD